MSETTSCIGGRGACACEHTAVQGRPLRHAPGRHPPHHGFGRNDSGRSGWSAASGRGTALLVDDKEFVRLSTVDMLAELGYEVLEASTAEEGLALVQNGAEINLPVTDHLMPGMMGSDLARAVQTLRPGVAILVISGYAESEGIEPDLPRLTKPFRKDELVAGLASLVNGSSSQRGNCARRFEFCKLKVH
jgi:CheY-like chemotaxis protein